MSKALIYTRSATGTGLEFQEAACRAFAERQGYEVVDVRQGAGSSDVVEQALADVENRVSHVLISEKSETYSRNSTRVLSLISQATDRGIRVFTADGTELTGAEGKLRLGLMAALAEYESNLAEEERKATQLSGYTQISVTLDQAEIAALEERLKGDSATQAIWFKIQASIDDLREETATAVKRCADCGKPLPEGYSRSECRHCAKCVDFACMSNHGERAEQAAGNREA
ncbi:hypothetical protein GCM10010331_44230 [Streptomyces xanthochromogenes]|uniref:recombinase family protein n=1 Tax=Streptomyces xanthochromogenes TaxID=67384 RepID=UPI0016730542|nr:recombinase family protein [Streptomyces xanthochromogenes]GHB51846.1 hypothetical protein GCM10010331_44230 [Streptomyces xanthochromogenes]